VHAQREHGAAGPAGRRGQERAGPLQQRARPGEVGQQPLLEVAGGAGVDVALQDAMEHGQQPGQPGVPLDGAADQPGQAARVAARLGL